MYGAAQQAVDPKLHPEQPKPKFHYLHASVQLHDHTGLLYPSTRPVSSTTTKSNQTSQGLHPMRATLAMRSRLPAVSKDHHLHLVICKGNPEHPKTTSYCMEMCKMCIPCRPSFKVTNL